MKFLFILTQVEDAWAKTPPGEGERVYQQYMDEALEWAKRMPNYGHGSIEIRPFWE